MIIVENQQEILHIDLADLRVLTEPDLMIRLDELATHPFEQEVFEWTNAIRVQHQLVPLTRNLQLSQCARFHAQDMALNGFISHTGSDGSSLRERVARAGYINWMFVGENCACGQATPEEVVNGWMNSPNHRQNMLSKDFVEIGIAYVIGQTPTTTGGWTHGGYWVQNFARPLPNNAIQTIIQWLLP